MCTSLVKRSMPFFVTFFFFWMLHEWEIFMDSEVNVSYLEWFCQERVSMYRWKVAGPVLLKDAWDSQNHLIFSHFLPLSLPWQKTRCFIVAKLLVESMTSFKSELCYLLPFQETSTNYRFAFWPDSSSSAAFSLHFFHCMQTNSDLMTLWFGPQWIFYTDYVGMC